MYVVIGISSCIIIAVPSLNFLFINLGYRQKNRYCSKSVIQCSTNPKDLEKSLKKAYSRSFLSSLKKYKNPYESKNVHKKILIFLKTNKLIH